MPKTVKSQPSEFQHPLSKGPTKIMIRTLNDDPVTAPIGESELAEIQRVNRWITNVTPTPDGIERIEHLRSLARDLVAGIILNAPASRERSLALTHLEDAVMWGVKSIVLES